MKILVGFLTTPEGRAALERAAAEARHHGGTLVLVHSMRGGARDEDEEALAYADALEEAESRLRAEGLDVEVRRLVRGQTPSEDLLDVAKEDDVDLIVIGLRRRSPVGKLVLGSNAQDILLRADCAVLAVKAHPHEA
ncbi:MAG: universal stress protein [Actinomycetota bacterium]